MHDIKLTGQNKLRPMSFFFRRRNVKYMSKLSRLLPKEVKQMKFETKLKFYSSILGKSPPSFS